MKSPIPTDSFVLNVARHGDTFLVVQERDGSWYLPAGRVEAGENLVAAVVRETIEEAAQLVGVHGLVGIDHEWRDGRARLRFVFSTYRGVLIPPKDRPDEHSLRAAWLTRDAIALLPLRHEEVLRWIDLVAGGAPVLPTGAYEWISARPPRQPSSPTPPSA